MHKTSLRHQTLAAAVLLAFAAPALAAQPSLWQRVRADPRAAYVATMTPAERYAFARDYGLQDRLPAPTATTRTVTNCNDSGSGSLRDAVAASASGDIVDASGLACSTISLTTGAIDIGVSSLTIQGPGPDALKVGNGSKYYHRVFNHTGTGTLTIAGMTVTRGTIRTGGTDPGSTGGCINSAGKVALGDWLEPANRERGVVVSDCAAISTQADVEAMGGGVYANRGMFLYASVVSGCSAIAQDAGHGTRGGGVATVGYLFSKYSEIRDNALSGSNASGGGVFAPYTLKTAISNSTIAGNYSSGSAGGAFLGASGASDSVVDIYNSTISGNTSSTGTGGVFVNAVADQLHGKIRIASTTISDNHGQTGDFGCDAGGAELLGDTIDLQSSIVSGNTCDDQSSDLNIYGSLSGPAVTVTGANNLIGVPDPYSAPPPPTGLITSNHPGLAPLANNGGLTRTHALLPTSPAIDHGNNSAGNDYDQRGAGHPRVIGAAADIGAFERNPDVIFYSGFE